MGTLEVTSHVLLWCVVLMQGIIIVALARQIGFLHRQLDYRGARIMNVGPRIGEVVRSIELIDIFNRPIKLGVERNKRTLLIFISTACSTCATLLPEITKLAHDERKHLDVLLAAYGISLEDGQRFAAELGIGQTTPLIVSNELASLYQVSLTPYGLLTDQNGILRAKGLVNNLTDIESLLNADELAVRSVDEYVNRSNAAQPRAL